MTVNSAPLEMDAKELKTELFSWECTSEFFVDIARLMFPSKFHCNMFTPFIQPFFSCLNFQEESV